MKLSVKDPAPAFTLPDQDGNLVSLNQFAGKRIVLYFYPKDFTPGCTTQACELRDALKLDELDADVILGISGDSPEVHRKFIDEYGLGFSLLSDPTKSTMTNYGAYGEKQSYGKTVIGVIRSTFVIGKDQTIEAALYGVKAKGHANRLIKSLNQILTN